MLHCLSPHLGIRPRNWLETARPPRRLNCHDRINPSLVGREQRCLELKRDGRSASKWDIVLSVLCCTPFGSHYVAVQHGLRSIALRATLVYQRKASRFTL